MSYGQNNPTDRECVCYRDLDNPDREGDTDPVERERVIAKAHEEFLAQHPEYVNTFSYGILTRRLGGGWFEHFRYAADLGGKPERASPESNK